MRGRLANVPFFNVLRRLLIKTDTQTNAHKQMCKHTHTKTYVSLFGKPTSAQLKAALLLNRSPPHLTSLHLHLSLSLCVGLY